MGSEHARDLVFEVQKTAAICGVCNAGRSQGQNITRKNQDGLGRDCPSMSALSGLAAWMPFDISRWVAATCRVTNSLDETLRNICHTGLTIAGGESRQEQMLVLTLVFVDGLL